MSVSAPSHVGRQTPELAPSCGGVETPLQQHEVQGGGSGDEPAQLGAVPVSAHVEAEGAGGSVVATQSASAPLHTILRAARLLTHFLQLSAAEIYGVEPDCGGLGHSRLLAVHSRELELTMPVGAACLLKRRARFVMLCVAAAAVAAACVPAGVLRGAAQCCGDAI
jgi:hypothetical protein